VFAQRSERVSTSRDDLESSGAPDASVLYERHAAGLLRYLTRMCGDPDLAADAVQETFARMLARPVPDERSHAWLFRVGTNVVREWARTGRRRSELLRAAPGGVATGDTAQAPDAELERRQLAQRVRAALDRLPERDRTILLMREEGFTHQQIASAVGTTTKSVGTLVARALRRMSAEIPLRSEWTQQ
jgi:RNA polymerase sigma-70 factor (ECF subfamily)